MKTCLVVDDSKVIRSIAGKIVGALGFQVREAADGRQALDACSANMPDAILLDWNMPVMNGIEFLKELMSRATDYAPPVIFCTTESTVSHIQEAIAAGAKEYVMKPFDREILESKFRQIGLID
jgi:two-component system chemotaxis response regulator CheY